VVEHPADLVRIAIQAAAAPQTGNQVSRT
jgi:hypothetical protein